MSDLPIGRYPHYKEKYYTFLGIARHQRGLSSPKMAELTPSRSL
jgi:hypothetical protein